MIQQMRMIGRQLALIFSEPVRVKGKPRVKMSGSGVADYVSGSGMDTLLFGLASDSGGEARALDLNGGAITACEASATFRPADLSLRVPQRFTTRFYEPFRGNALPSRRNSTPSERCRFVRRGSIVGEFLQANLARASLAEFSSLE